MTTVDSCGRSGGLVSLWDPTTFSCSEVIKHRYFLCVYGELIPSGTRMNLVNVYVPSDATAQKNLSTELLALRNSRQGLWAFMGDFNDVRQSDERLNSEYVAANADAFNDFILSDALQEYDMGGAKFTYISDRGDKLSKQDRFLFSFNGPGDLALATKLRWLKSKIKEWIVVEQRREERALTEAELSLRMDCKQYMLEFDKQRQSDTRQKSRVRWAVKGDKNTSFFFHSVVNALFKLKLIQRGVHWR
ncbi:uncharacterized protein LOC110887810 [Helianthus annuus]|uniref:uncharacterized protein LOC110887810 n=1 Tax=Helianthus annuus TaxID=4232 RepID=UPI000B8FDE95|nr:uncharacterized protein LOC110887810 [Helianthus annuus]